MSFDPNTEKLLRRALRPEAPPAGFADRVLARTASIRPEPAAPARRWWQVRPVLYANAVAALVAVLAGTFAYQRHEQQKALEAREQLITALNITHVSLRKAQERMRRVSAKPQP